MNIIIRIIISLILAVISMLNTTGGYKPGIPEQSAKELIEKAVVTYGYYEDASLGRVNELMEMLRKKDPAEYKRWSEIMGLWRAGLTENLNYDVLPDGLPDTEELCIVVLGFELCDDGSMRSELIGRLRVALNNGNKYKNAYILCSGGGTAADNSRITEAGQMAEWLENKGVKKDRIIIENRSETTAQNVMYSYDILKEKYPGVKKLAVVTSDYHMEPSLLFFKAKSILDGDGRFTVVSNAVFKAPTRTLTVLFRAAALIELTGDEKTARLIYNRTYDFESLSPFN